MVAPFFKVLKLSTESYQIRKIGAAIFLTFNYRWDILICASPNTKNQNLKIFFIPFPITTYELYPPQAESNFRYKSASSSHYRGACHYAPFDKFIFSSGFLSSEVLTKEDYPELSYEQRTMNNDLGGDTYEAKRPK